MAQRELRAIVLGAGMAGILAGIKLRERGITDFTIYEKADRVGGTWRENTYPGLTCDVPSHHYTYTFERNPDWTRHLPPGPEVQAYFEDVTIKYGLAEAIEFGCEAVRAEFIEGRWLVELKDGRRDSADVLIAATGVLHHPKRPDIPGLDSFNGDLFHSAQWDHSVPLDGKRIGVIGNGSTGVQIISALSGRAGLIEHYTRTPQWIMPVENGYFSEEERAAFRDPEVLAAAMDFEGYNAAVDRYTEAIIDDSSEGAQEMARICLANLEENVTDPELRERLRPDHKPLCKRLVWSPDYYRAIQHPQAALVTEGIESVEPEGIRTRDGELHKLDIIVLATGFRANAFMRPMDIIGRDGADLNALWGDLPKAYFAIGVPAFPNLFMLNGPNGPVGNFSLIDIAEHQWHYIGQLLDRLQFEGVKEICPTDAAMSRFEQEREAAAKRTVWYTGGCSSWYLDSRGIPASWPWSYSRFVEMMNEPRWQDFAEERV
ncbi:MAG: NAD(P)/FAD-dependent oxidoreductase [Pseudomonadota bacterium]